MKKTVLSCVQPTGKLHLGRYFGAVKHWVDLQDSYDCIYGIVNYHAMTMPYDPKKLVPATWKLTFDLVACGIHPEHVFIQSLVPEHAELFWILNTMTSYGELSRMTQFKDKSLRVQTESKNDFISSALYTYPVLQAADILIYKADYVPVGKDQEQHLELSRNIAQRFNHTIGKEFFKAPEALYTEVPKVMSTADPSRKMSASLGEKHHIDVFADPDRIRKQIRSAVTDTGASSTVMSEGVSNLFSLLKASGAHDAWTNLLAMYKDRSLKYGELKEVVGEALVDITEPMRAKRQEIELDKKTVKSIIKDSSAQIRKQAQETLREVKEMVGLLNVKF